MGIEALPSGFVIANDARETRSNYKDIKNNDRKTKTSNAAIQEAAYQISLATQAILHEDNDICRHPTYAASNVQPLWRKKTYIPVIVTTANIFVCEFESKDVSSRTGEIDPSQAILTERESLVFEYALPRHLQMTPCSPLREVSAGPCCARPLRPCVSQQREATSSYESYDVYFGRAEGILLERQKDQTPDDRQSPLAASAAGR